MGATLSTPISVYAVKSGSLHKRACAKNCAANAADHCFVDIAGAVKKQKKRLHPEKERMQLFLWYNVIVKKQTPQGYYTAYQLKLPVEIEKNRNFRPGI